MPAAYDSYDYPSYWENREYEHKSELIALKSLLGKIPDIDTVLEIGTGFGRLVPTYSYRARKIILSDPSARLLSLARQTYKEAKNIKYIHSSLENLPSKIKKGSVDTIVMVRVIHHLENIKTAFETMYRLLAGGGYVILEFANKKHLKAIISEIWKGNLTFPIDIIPKDLSSKKSKKKGALPFINYHPEALIAQLTEIGFTPVEKLSVSNIRSTFLKRVFSLESLLKIETILQKPFGYLNFGPSIFVLLRKT